MNELKLENFDRKLCQSIKNCEKIILDASNGTYYTIARNNEKYGVIGFLFRNNTYFLQIAIHEDYRGLGIFEKALNLLINKHGIKKIYSTIAEDNFASIKAHRKIGFRRIPCRIEEDLKAKGLLSQKNIRLVKKCT